MKGNFEFCECTRNYNFIKDNSPTNIQKFLDDIYEIEWHLVSEGDNKPIKIVGYVRGILEFLTSNYDYEDDDPDLNLNLKERIDEFSKGNNLPSELLDRLHQIRQWSNSVLHSDKKFEKTLSIEKCLEDFYKLFSFLFTKEEESNFGNNKSWDQDIYKQEKLTHYKSYEFTDKDILLKLSRKLKSLPLIKISLEGKTLSETDFFDILLNQLGELRNEPDNTKTFSERELKYISVTNLNAVSFMREALANLIAPIIKIKLDLHLGETKVSSYIKVQSIDSPRTIASVISELLKAKFDYMIYPTWFDLKEERLQWFKKTYVDKLSSIKQEQLIIDDFFDSQLQLTDFDGFFTEAPTNIAEFKEKDCPLELSFASKIIVFNIRPIDHFQFAWHRSISTSELKSILIGKINEQYSNDYVFLNNHNVSCEPLLKNNYYGGKQVKFKIHHRKLLEGNNKIPLSITPINNPHNLSIETYLTINFEIEIEKTIRFKVSEYINDLANKLKIGKPLTTEEAQILLMWLLIKGTKAGAFPTIY